MSEPLDHVLRRSLPWRKETPRTECGLEAAGRPTLTWTALLAKVKQQGKQRSAMTTCMTCWQTAMNWQHRSYRYSGSELCEDVARECNGQDMRQLEAELYAMAALVEAHREEFDEYMTGLGETVSLKDRRDKRKK